jgi:Trk-type K+ transport system membrane component
VFDKLQALGLGIIVFAIIIGVGVVVLHNFSGSIAVCTGAGSPAWNSSAGACTNSSGATSTPANAAYTNTAYMNTQLGTTGLAGWTPAVIALAVGLMFIGAFMFRSSKGRY